MGTHTQIPMTVILIETKKVFEHAYSAGMHPDDILDSIASMQPTPGMSRLLESLAAAGWDILLLTDANTVFVNHWLKTHGFEDIVTEVVTNRAFWERGRLFIEPCMHQQACNKCPTNLCKSIALAQFCASRDYSRIVYAGDGRNDYCPTTNLPANVSIFDQLMIINRLATNSIFGSIPNIRQGP
ncbi:hypothetical protein evm_012270 [Chilo suppressalis]|nr:hypothetical protein evm_012270 [Chilo suppressalis]